MTAKECVAAIEASAITCELDGQALPPPQMADVLFPTWREENFQAKMLTGGTTTGTQRERLWASWEVLNWLDHMGQYVTPEVGGPWIVYRRIGGCARHFLLAICRGQSVSLWTTALQGTCVTDHIAGKWDGMLAAIRRLQPTLIQGHPYLLKWLVSCRALDSVRLFISTDYRLTSELVRVVDAIYPALDLLDMYGHSELGAVTIATKADKLARLDTSGRVAPWATMEDLGGGKWRMEVDGRSVVSIDSGYVDADGYFYITQSLKGKHVCERSADLARPILFEPL